MTKLRRPVLTTIALSAGDDGLISASESSYLTSERFASPIRAAIRDTLAWKTAEGKWGNGL